jgi:hypothetical protein
MTAAQPTPAARKDGLYVYCVVSDKGEHLLGPVGLDDHDVYTVRAGDLCAIVHKYPVEPYQSNDRQTVERWVLAHQRVIQMAAERFETVLPMAFNMIVQGGPNGDSAENLRAWLAEMRERFVDLLNKLPGKAEYGVQIFWDRRLVAEGLVKSDPKLGKMRDEAKGKPKGLAYMLEQKLAKATRAAVEKQAGRYVNDFYTRIRECVEDVRIDKLKKADSPGAPGMLLNLSCLMQKDSPALAEVLEGIQQTEGISVRFTGPWPPYSFVCAG